jgi:hypothetical protein
MTATSSRTAIKATGRSTATLWTSRILFGLVVLFLAFDAALKVFATKIAVEGTVRLGYPASTILVIGYVEVLCLAVLLVPRTAIPGAILWTGYLGGAVATHVRASGSLFGEILFPVYVAAALWGASWLLDRRTRTLLAKSH